MLHENAIQPCKSTVNPFENAVLTTLFITARAKPRNPNFAQMSLVILPRTGWSGPEKDPTWAAYLPALGSGQVFWLLGFLSVVIGFRL